MNPFLENLADMLEQYQPEQPDQKELKARFISFVAHYPECNQRDHFPGHITASVWVTSNNHQRALLLHHAKLDLWVQPGGHVEAQDDSVEQACLRELEEEAGLSKCELVTRGIFDLDVHSIPARKNDPEHQHWDVRLWFETLDDQISGNEESLDIGWFGPDEILGLNADDSVMRMVRKSLILNS